MSKDEKRLKELEAIPLYDVKGGRQRTSAENEEIIKLRIKIANS